MSIYIYAETFPKQFYSLINLFIDVNNYVKMIPPNFAILTSTDLMFRMTVFFLSILSIYMN